VSFPIECVGPQRDVRVAVFLRRDKPSMTTGVVKWYNPSKGYGFIQPEDGSPDVFVHISDVETAGLGSLKEGQRIGYELVRGKNGKSNAGNLKAA
jgi:CspA family cold shock protein